MITVSCCIHPEVKLRLTKQQTKMIISALATVMPHGGGSDEMVLLQRITNGSYLEEDHALTAHYANGVVDAYKELTNG